jgi:hypothetical protein
MYVHAALEVFCRPETCLLTDPRFIEEHHEYKMATRKAQEAQPWRGPIPQDVMSFWGKANRNCQPRSS